MTSTELKDELDSFSVAYPAKAVKATVRPSSSLQELKSELTDLSAGPPQLVKLLEQARAASSPPPDAASTDASGAPLVDSVNVDKSAVQADDDAPASEVGQAQGQDESPVAEVVQQAPAAAAPLAVALVGDAADKKEMEEPVNTKTDEVLEDSSVEMDGVKEQAAAVEAPAAAEEKGLKRPLDEQVDDSEGPSQPCCLVRPIRPTDVPLSPSTQSRLPLPPSDPSSRPTRSIRLFPSHQTSSRAHIHPPLRSTSRASVARSLTRPSPNSWLRSASSIRPPA